MKPQLLTRRFLASLSIVIAVFFFEYQVIASAISQFFLRFAQAQAPHQSKKIVNSLERAFAWQGHNAEILVTIGEYHHDSGENTQNLLEAEKSFRQAIKNHPSKAKNWVKLAYVKANLNQFDQEFFHAYETAFTYGGREYDVSFSLVKLGLVYWDSMRTEYRPIIKKSVINLYEADKTAILDLAESYGKLKMICIWAANDEKHNNRCDRLFSKKKKRFIHRRK